MLTRVLPLLLGALVALPALSQELPNRPIRWIVPYAAGGTGDIAVRAVVPGLAERLGRTIVVENRGGANGIPGTEAAARAPADGTTLVLGVFGPLTVLPHMMRMPFDPQKDLAPVGLMISVPNLVVVPPESPIRSIADLVAAAKARPGELTNGAVGVGSSGQLSGGLLGTMAGIRFTTVGYAGGAPAQIDLMAGRLDVMFDNAPGALPRVRAGQLRALGTTGLRRSPILPEIPSVSESGYPGYEVTTWMGALMPGGTPPALISIVNRALVETLNEPALNQRLTSQMYDVIPGTPEQFAAYIVSETAKWGQVVRDNNIRID